MNKFTLVRTGPSDPQSDNLECDSDIQQAGFAEYKSALLNKIGKMPPRKLKHWIKQFI